MYKLFLGALTSSWLTKALCYTPEEAHKSLERFHLSNNEQLDSLDDMIIGGLIDQSLEEIGKSIKSGTTLMVSWHWAGYCDGVFEMEYLDHS